MSDQIEQIYQESRQTYDSPRIQAALPAADFRVGRQRVMRVMAKINIRARRTKAQVQSND